MYYFKEPNFSGNSFSQLLLSTYFLPILEDLHQNIVFQQNQAPTHYIRARRNLLHAEVPFSWSGMGGARIGQLALQISTHVTFSCRDALEKKSTDASVLASLS